MGNAPTVRLLGRYALYGTIASGGVATVHYGRLAGAAGFARTVAIKRLHPQFAEDPDFVSMFVDEARLASRVHSPHVVPTLDVFTTSGELFLVMEYVAGESLARLMRAATAARERVPVAVAVAVMAGVLRGLHAAHEALDERGDPLGIVHRDVSPQNVIVGSDGLARVLDFGVAKASGRLQTTREGQLKGKLCYMGPEQLRGEQATRTTDVYAASVVLWEVLVGEGLFRADNDGAIVTRVLQGNVTTPSRASAAKSAKGTARDEESQAALERLDSIVMRGLDREPRKRFGTALEMAIALEQCVPPAAPALVGAWVAKLVGTVLAGRAAQIAAIERIAPAEIGPLAAAARTPAESIAPPASTAQAAPESSVSVTTDAGRHRASPRAAAARTTAIVIVAAGLVLAAPLALYLRARSTRAAPAVVLPVAGSVAPQPASPSAPEMPVVGGAPSTSTVGADAASARAGIAPATAPSRATSPRRPSIGRPKSLPSSARKQAPACTPPYFFDAEGNRVFKTECL